MSTVNPLANPLARTWSLPLEREREWPVGVRLSALTFRAPTLADRAQVPDIETTRFLPDRSVVYGVDWGAVSKWLKLLVLDRTHEPLIDVLDLGDAERAKDALLGFLPSAAASKAKEQPPTTSSSEQGSPASIRID